MEEGRLNFVEDYKYFNSINQIMKNEKTYNLVFTDIRKNFI